jgi:Tfp pilus assembly protein PilF
LRSRHSSRAIARDPDYSPAHSGRAFAYAIEPGWSLTLPVEVAYAKALADADEAMRLDPDNAEAYMVRGSCAATTSSRMLRMQILTARVPWHRAASTSSILPATTSNSPATCGLQNA